MHRSSGRAYTTLSGSRTVPWYNLPSPTGPVKYSNVACFTDDAIAPSGESYRPVVLCGSYAPGTYWPEWVYWGKFFLGPLMFGGPP